MRIIKLISKEGIRILTEKAFLIVFIVLICNLTSCSTNKLAASTEKESDNSQRLRYKPETGIRAPYKSEYYNKLRSKLIKDYSKIVR